jgi:hypothetical protein
MRSDVLTLHETIGETRQPPAEGRKRTEEFMRIASRSNRRSFGRRSAASRGRLLNAGAFVLLFVLLIVSGACGTGSGFNPNNVTVTVSPAATAISAGGQVPLQATVKGLGSGFISSINLWTIAENPSGSDCATYVGIVAPGPCPAGTIQLPDANELSVTYIAPSTPGTYHINAEWEDFVNLSGPPIATKTGTSVITVSP